MSSRMEVSHNMNKYIDEQQVAELTGIAVQTLRNWRSKRRFIRYCKVGRAVRYDIRDVHEFMEGRKIKVTE